MSQSQSNPIPAPRVIVELGPKGELILESYINGQRTREVLNEGFELWDIKTTLMDIASRRKSEAQRKAERQAKIEAERHREVYLSVAHAHGKGFADRTVGAPEDIKAKLARQAEARAKVEAKTKVKAELETLYSEMDEIA